MFSSAKIRRCSGRGTLVVAVEIVVHIPLRVKRKNNTRAISVLLCPLAPHRAVLNHDRWRARLSPLPPTPPPTDKAAARQEQAGKSRTGDRAGNRGDIEGESVYAEIVVIKVRQGYAVESYVVGETEQLRTTGCGGTSNGQRL